MSHPDEALLTTYIDDALAGAARTDLESHLVGCRECRTRVVALRDESAFLSDVLRGRERPTTSAAPIPETEASVALGVPIAIAGVGTVLGVGSALLESQMPGGLDLLNPLRLKGAYEMAFDFIFFLRDTAPGLVELLVALGALASVSALLSFGVGILYRHLFGATAGALLLWVSLGAEPAGALILHIDEDVHVAAGEVIDDNVVVTGDLARIDGTVRGDVVAVVERMQISGRIEGNLYVLARDLDLTGQVAGSVYSVAERARIDGSVEGNSVAASEDFTLTSDGRVGRSAWLILEHGSVDGSVGRDLVVGGERLDMSGGVERHVSMVYVDAAVIRSGATVGGDVSAMVEDAEDLVVDSGAEIGGEVTVEEQGVAHERYLDAYRTPRLYVIHAISFCAAFAFGLILYALMPGADEVGIGTSRDFFRNLGMGFVLLVVPPCAILLAGLTLVGLPVAVLTAFVYITCLYCAELLVGAWLGRTLMGPEDGESLWSFARVYFVGLGLLSLASQVPFIGPPLAVISLLAGLGLIFDRARRLPVFARSA